jgi:FtsH-binding integral membrane protein
VTAWIRLARGAALAMVVWSLALQAMVGTVIPIVAVIGGAFLGFAWFLRGERRRLSLAVAIFSVLIYAGNLPVILAELGRPESAPSFILTLLSTLAVVVAAVSGLGAFLSWRPTPISRLIGAAVAVLVLGTVFSLVAAAGTDSDTALPTDAVVTIAGMQFEPWRSGWTPV